MSYLCNICVDGDANVRRKSADTKEKFNVIDYEFFVLLFGTVLKTFVENVQTSNKNFRL